jgi:flagellar motility protein MotE (MotC chaperone)
MRPAVRPPFNADADTAAQMANELRNQKEVFKTLEKELVARQKNLEIIFHDMKTERTLVEDLRKQCKDELQAAADQLEILERKAGTLDGKRKQMSDQMKDIEKKVTGIKDLEKDNIKRLANVYDTMDAHAAAELLQRMADMGMIETAVGILATMQNRQTAKILAEFPDKSAAVQILEKMKTVERPPNPGKTGQ